MCLLWWWSKLVVIFFLMVDLIGNERCISVWEWYSGISELVYWLRGNVRERVGFV